MVNDSGAATGSPGVLFVDDEPDNISLVAEILGDSLELPVAIADSVERAVELLHERPWKAVVMDLFIPLGDHPQRILGPRAQRYQENVEHLGGLVLLEELDRLSVRPMVVSHTQCTDHVLLDLFDGRIKRMIPKPAPMEVLLTHLRDLLA
ncbi:MAG: hypothetical protein KTR31_21430 [Myxococcales bacterium]|nr:hypothetical protein [Myxococcales bacterium]